MALNEGEQDALVIQISTIITAAERKLQQLGLKNAAVATFDRRRVPMEIAGHVLTRQEWIDMANERLCHM